MQRLLKSAHLSIKQIEGIMSIIISVVYHSGYGHTAKVAEAIAKGSMEKGAEVSIIKADIVSDDDWRRLDSSHAIIFGAPTYMGSVSGAFKMFMDATSKRWGTQAWKDKVAAGFTNSGSYVGDKLASIQQLFHFSMQHGMIWVGQAESAPQFEDNEQVSLDAINRLGSWSGLMTQSNHKSSAESAPAKGDLETAKRFGNRVAVITSKLINQPL